MIIVTSEAARRERLTLDDLRKIMRWLKTQNFANIEEGALDGINQRIKALPSPESLTSIEQIDGGTKRVEAEIGQIMRLLEEYGNKNMEFKARFLAKKKMPPRYKVLNWESNMKKADLIRNLVKISEVADESGDYTIAQKSLDLAERATSEENIDSELENIDGLIVASGNQNLIKLAMWPFDKKNPPNPGVSQPVDPEGQKRQQGAAAQQQNKQQAQQQTQTLTQQANGVINKINNLMIMDLQKLYQTGDFETALNNMNKYNALIKNVSQQVSQKMGNKGQFQNKKIMDTLNALSQETNSIVQQIKQVNDNAWNSMSKALQQIAQNSYKNLSKFQQQFTQVVPPPQPPTTNIPAGATATTTKTPDSLNQDLFRKTEPEAK